jgi:hypothetical protein
MKGDRLVDSCSRTAPAISTETGIFKLEEKPDVQFKFDSKDLAEFIPEIRDELGTSV